MLHLAFLAIGYHTDGMYALSQKICPRFNFSITLSKIDPIFFMIFGM